MKIYYGIPNFLVDVTQICQSLKRHNIIIIPDGDHNRALLFKDHLPGTEKYIYTETSSGMTQYDQTMLLHIEEDHITTTSVDTRLKDIHSTLILNHGTFDEEIPEQKMSIRYLTGKESVLEIGGNIGRNSLMIASLLKNINQLVVLESNGDIFTQLTENKNLNSLQFFIENTALSKRKLIQQGWETKPSMVLSDGYDWVNTITFDQLQEKYMTFDTLILDCEGAFYYILMDMPEILKNINLIIMENDYGEEQHKKDIDSVLYKNNFINIYVESGGWGPCKNNFFEVWQKC
jgi:FkbM family methyltransferase